MTHPPSVFRFPGIPLRIILSSYSIQQFPIFQFDKTRLLRSQANVVPSLVVRNRCVWLGTGCSTAVMVPPRVYAPSFVGKGGCVRGFVCSVMCWREYEWRVFASSTATRR